MNASNGKNRPELLCQIEDLKQQIADLKAVLLESENKFVVMIDAAPVGIFIDDAQGKAIYVNKKCAELVGVPAEKSLNFDWMPFLHPDDRERMMSEWKNAFENSKEFHLEYRWVHSNGDVVWTLGEVIPILGNDGKATLFIGSLTDITAQKAAEIGKEALLQERERAQQVAQNYLERLQIATRAARIGIWDWNIVDNVLIWDDTICELYGVPHGSFPDGIMEWSEHIHPDDRSRVLDEFQAGLRGECEYAPEFRIIWPDGSIHDLKANSQVFWGASGKPVRMAGTNIDITASKRAQEEIRLLNVDLEQRVRERTAGLDAANKELESFSYSVSHDLRAPLRGIDGFSQALLEDYADRLDETGKHYLGRIRASASQMGELIDDMLKLSRISKITLLRKPVDLHALALSIVDELREREPQRSVEVRVAEPLQADADLNLMRIALENLLGNAWKFTAKTPQAWIEFGQLPPSGPNAPATFFVRDNGAGFDMAYAEKLFTVFQRLHRQDEFPGTGVGLATVARIIHLHGGEIRAEGVVGQGASFLFTLSQGCDFAESAG